MCVSTSTLWKCVCLTSVLYSPFHHYGLWSLINYLFSFYCMRACIYVYMFVYACVYECMLLWACFMYVCECDYVWMILSKYHCLNVGCIPSRRSECCQHSELTWQCLQTKYIFCLCSRQRCNTGGPLGIYVDTHLGCLRHMGGILYYWRFCCAGPRMSQRTLQRRLLTNIHGPRTKDNGMYCRETRLIHLCFCACFRTFMLTLRLHERWWVY